MFVWRVFGFFSFLQSCEKKDERKNFEFFIEFAASDMRCFAFFSPHLFLKLSFEKQYTQLLQDKLDTLCDLTGDRVEGRN